MISWTNLFKSIFRDNNKERTVWYKLIKGKL